MLMFSMTYLLAATGLLVLTSEKVRAAYFIKVRIVESNGTVTTAKEVSRDLYEVIRNNRFRDISNVLIPKDLQSRLPSGDTALHLAVYSGSTETLRALLNKGVPVDLKDGKGRTALWVAASKGNIESIKVLYEFKANIYETREGCKELNRTILHEAAIAGNDDAVSWLISKKLDLEARECDGWTPLHWAAYYGHTRTIQLLELGGANVNVKSNFWTTPLHWASQKGHTDTVFLLIQLDAMVNVHDVDGWTPLHRAAQYGRMETVRLLVGSRAELNAKTSNGETPCSIANFGGYYEVVEFLKSYDGVECNPETPKEIVNVNSKSFNKGFSSKIVNFKIFLYLEIMLYLFICHIDT